MEIEFVISWTEDKAATTAGMTEYIPESHEFFSDNLLDVLAHEKHLRERIHHMEVNRHDRVFTRNIDIKARVKQ